MNARLVIALITIASLALLGCGSSDGDTATSSGNGGSASTGSEWDVDDSEKTEGMNMAGGSSDVGEGRHWRESDFEGNVYIVNPDGSSYIVLVPNLDAPGTEISDMQWIHDGTTQEAPVGNKYNPITWMDLSQENYFWAQLLGRASEFEVEVKVDKRFETWHELLETKIIDVIEDDYGGEDTINMTTDWYFTQTEPS